MVLFLILTLQNSVGNVVEILELLDKDNHTGEEIQRNYAYLIDKWGEWEIVGAGMAGLVIRYVDVGNALFSGLMITFSVFSFVMLVAAIVFGKIVFPLLSKHYEGLNEEMVDLATLQSAQQIDELTQNSKKEWF